MARGILSLRKTSDQLPKSLISSKVSTATFKENNEFIGFLPAFLIITSTANGSSSSLLHTAHIIEDNLAEPNKADLVFNMNIDQVIGI